MIVLTVWYLLFFSQEPLIRRVDDFEVLVNKDSMYLVPPIQSVNENAHMCMVKDVCFASYATLCGSFSLVEDPH